MSNATRDQIATPYHEGAKHEPRDVDFAGILVTAAALALTVALSCVVCWWLLAGTQPSNTETTSAPWRLPPEPRLEQVDRMETAQSQDIAAQLRTQALGADRQLNTYGWVDRQTKIVRIPIRAAIRIVVDNNWLPAVSDAAPESRDPKVSPSKAP